MCLSAGRSRSGIPVGLSCGFCHDMGPARKLMTIQCDKVVDGLSDEELENDCKRVPMSFSGWDEKLKTFDIGSAVEVNVKLEE